MVWTNPDAPTQAHTPKCRCDDYASLTATWLDKKNTISNFWTHKKKFPISNFYPNKRIFPFHAFFFFDNICYLLNDK